ncbi:hypothetical protein CR983_02035 [Candidatus Saccharibacteria bacterium]|nr:MAG: hypothetical protein CR983_02035 [Candidatus Saccharibacteria bacterium]
MRKTLIIIFGVVLIAALGAGTWYALTNNQDNQANDATQTSNPRPENSVEVNGESLETDVDQDGQADGRYVVYAPPQVGAAGYDTTLLFFHAPWCPDCQAFDAAIRDGTIPAGTQILLVDYDSYKDLRQQYGVTVQTTFVRVDSEGNKKASWIGNGNASLDAVLENTK